MFFSFDGVDGAGKSTQIRLLADWLRARGREVITCRDPGTTSLGEKLRGLLLEHHDTPIHRRAEMLLYMAARAQLVEEVIRPALQAGRDVLSDRFLLANVVYQAHAGGPLTSMAGMGLGLYISRQIVELHAGTIEAEFPDEGGTKFVVTLPLTQPGVLYP